MKLVALPTKTICASEEQRAHLRLHLEQENQHRRSIGFDQFDLENELQLEIAKLEYALCHDRLRPIIEELFVLYPGSPGVAGRIKGHIELYDEGVRILRDREGILPPQPMLFDLMKFLELYEQGELDRWGGAFATND